jgi:hypothetical protein
MSVPVFDFQNEWLAIVQVALVLVLPILVGLVTDKLSSSLLKVVLLGGLTYAATLLTGLGDALSAGVAFDWVNLAMNGFITWALAAASYAGILKPSGLIAKAQSSTAVQVFDRPHAQGAN